MKNPNAKLMTLIKLHRLTYVKVAELCCCGRTTVYYWTRKANHKDFCRMGAAYLKLLQFELGLGEPSWTIDIRLDEEKRLLDEEIMKDAA